MLFLAKLAARNLWRNRLRTVLTFSALAVGIAWLVLVDSLITGLDNQGVATIVDFESGDVQIHAPGYFADRDDLPLGRTLPAHRAASTALGVPGVQAATPRVRFGARLNVGWEEFPVIGVGIDPARDSGVFRLADHIEGRLPRAGAHEAVIGAKLADLLEIHAGDAITLVTRTRDEAWQALDLTVVGLARTPHPGVNEGQVYLPLDVADSALALGGGATEVALRLAPGQSATAVAQEARERLNTAGVEAEAVTWQESAADFLSLTRTKSSGNAMIVLMIVIIALVGVTNTILLGTLERRQEIGTMKAMGLREGEIVRLFLLEATGIGLLAALTGSTLGAAANLYLVRVGVDFSALFGDITFNIPGLLGRVHGVWHGGVFLWASAVGIATCWLAASFPARRAARLDAAVTVRI
ncbi:ABC transporter permease [Limnochorda pilosa]|uniref:ABC transporter permease n=1 Tax=Limnochorda pilosa TaxID=1555112 RepID=A0A0K2SHA0_LIMPI|nr:ABC transporter permease [Limnochorda pilosa]BAS26470.1 ABC transporter permease [Limnochorda pilosa]